MVKSESWLGSQDLELCLNNVLRTKCSVCERVALPANTLLGWIDEQMT